MAMGMKGLPIIIRLFAGKHKGQDVIPLNFIQIVPLLPAHGASWKLNQKLQLFLFGKSFPLLWN
jgi:hypothetical protein